VEKHRRTAAQPGLLYARAPPGCDCKILSRHTAATTTGIPGWGSIIPAWISCLAHLLFPAPAHPPHRRYAQPAARLSRRFQAVGLLSLLSTGSAHGGGASGRDIRLPVINW